jgi:hypothetical protein
MPEVSEEMPDRLSIDWQEEERLSIERSDPQDNPLVGGIN